MGKKSKSHSSKADAGQASGSSASALPFLGGKAALDASVASLFEKSAGPVKAPGVTYAPALQRSKPAKKSDDVDVAVEQEESSVSEDEAMEGDSEPSESNDAAEEKITETHGRKRKRGPAEDDLEETYMRRIAKEERQADEKRKADLAKRQKQVQEDRDGREGSNEHVDNENSDAAAEAESSDEEDSQKGSVPVHESLAKASDEVEKSNRTVFLGNVSTQAIKSKSAKKTLLRHLASFCSTLSESTGPHKVESIRFRSVPFASGGGIPKRASFARRQILDETTPSTNAYAVYSTIQAARKAPAALNGTVVLDRHLRVDSIAHPAEIDNKRCVFVGNLDFVDQEASAEDEESGKKKKKKNAPADVEEGLWRTFNAHTGGSKRDPKAAKGKVEFVRVIRDGLTRVGKGFAYIQFYDGNCVEEALLLNEKKFPPLLPRKLRVTRARKFSKKREGSEAGPKDRRMGEAQKTMHGRAGKLLGRAGAAKVKADGRGSIAGNSFVFEGHRATEGSSMKVKTKSRGSKGKPKNRSAKRAAAYRAAGGKA